MADASASRRPMRATARLRAAVLPLVAALLAVFSLPSARAEIAQVLFEDDFAGTTIDPAKYAADAPFFEGGLGDIHAEAGNGVMHFVGSTTQQWWAGGTLRVVPTFTATEDNRLQISVDRVSEAGVGSASRSALWILDETKTKYVLFADVRGEGGWHYNRKIGEDGDVPTGGGNNIALFDGAAPDDGGQHRMSIIADGKTVKLLLDGVEGAEVKFPFSKVVVEFGSYARANGDTADTTWDNLKVERLRKTKTLLEDDFAGNTIDAARYAADAPFFEGGVGDIHAEAGNGVMHFVGTTTQQWWAGGTLRVVPTFGASEQTVVKASIDRVAEAGVGTASRSALWILDETKTKYVLFADVRGEGGWHYNRKIGEDGDVPTGGGTDITAFNDASFDDGGLHNMAIVADGKTVKLMLDGIVGAEVKFPFSKVVFEFGSYARANNDTADTTWDNFKVETTLRQSTVVFQDDFAANAIDPARYAADAPFFEGGVGDIHAEAGNGVMHFVGTTTQQWWAGGTLRVVPTFEAAEASVLTASIDRVAEAGVGTASRSALWILDATKTKYVLFADVRGEGGWHYNRKIGEDGDVPTGGGVNIAAFDGAAFDDGGKHTMSMIADGKTVKLLLDGVVGDEVKFPFSPVVFEFGSYARANNDTADTTWDNLVIETAGGATFAPTSTSVRVGQTSGEITLKIPAGQNSQNSVDVKVVSANPAIATPVGAVDGVLTLNFPAGGANTKTFKVQGVALGGTTLNIEGDVAAGNQLTVAVISGPGVKLDENFAGNTLDAGKWTVVNSGFEVGTGTYTVAPVDGVLDISGTAESDFWSGASLKTVTSFVATPELSLSVEVDRVALNQAGTAGRSSVFLTTADRSKFVMFSQNVGETGWSVNVNPGSATGSGTAISAFSTVDAANHHIKMVANGSTVELFLDGVSGGRFPFAVTTGIFVELAGYARATGDTVDAQFDNVHVENVLPCTTVAPAGISMTRNDSGQSVTVTVPTLLHDAAPMVVTVTSANPAVATPAGGVNGVLALTFAAGGPDSQTFTVSPTGLGSTTFSISSVPANCVAGSLTVDVVAVPETLLTDAFDGDTLNATKWVVDTTPFDTGTATGDSAVTVGGGTANFSVTVDAPLWPGITVYTANSYTAKLTEPLTFEINRVSIDFVLTTGTGAEERAGVWVREAGGNFVFLSDYVAHDGRNYGWRYNKVVNGAADDDAVGAGVNLGAFDGGTFDDGENHRLRIVANGAVVKLYVDGVFGASVPFPFTTGLTFGFGAYVDELGNVVTAKFDNALITGGAAVVVEPAKLTATVQNDGSVVISWTGDGTLQSSDDVKTFSNVTPAPAGKSLTIPAGSLAAHKFYRLN